MFALTSSRKWALATVCAAALTALPAAVFAQQDQDDPPPEAGRISYISGNVSIQPVTTEEWGQAYPNLPVGPGDRIFTDADGRAEIQVGRTYVRIGPNTDITLVDDSQFNINFGIAQGSIRVHSFGLWPRQLLDVSTPNGNAEFGNSGDLRVDVLTNDGATVFTNLGQFADITAAGDFRQELDYGQSLEVAGTNPVYPQWLQPAGADDLDAWSQQRDQQLARVVSYQYASPDMPGVSDLDAYGDWQPETEYGAVWFPRQVPADWEPYHYGHWINREPWGWVWVEDEPWGYAPFHYGRWVSYHGRWGWIPGPVNVRPVWSPALVVFTGGNFGVGLSAWFPLGPGEAYRPWYRCSPRYIDEVNITNIRPAPRVHVERTYVNIVNVTNVTYVNRTYVTAVRRDDFASGRSVRNVAVHVDPRQVQSMRPLQRPDVAPTARAIVTRPVAHPVPVRRERPVVINQQGREIAAKPHANPVAPPVRPIEQPRPIAGRTVISAPAHGNPPGRPGQYPEQGNRDQRPNSPNQGMPMGGPRPNPLPPQDGLRRPVGPVQGNPNQPVQNQPGPGNVPRANPVPPQPGMQRPMYPNQPGNRNDQQPQRPDNVPRANPVPPQPGMQRPIYPNQPGNPNAQQPQRPDNPQPGRPNYGQPNNQPPERPGHQPPQLPNNQRPDRPNYPQPGRPNDQQPNNQPPQRPNYQQPQQPNYGQPGRPNPPDYNSRPVNPPQQVQPNRPVPPAENRQPERPNQDRREMERTPPPQPQGRPMPPPQQQERQQAPPPQQPRYTPPPPSRQAEPPRPQRQEAAPQQQNRPRPDQNKDQRKNDKKDEKKHD